MSHGGPKAAVGQQSQHPERTSGHEEESKEKLGMLSLAQLLVTTTTYGK